jgi:peptidoglycan/LPS O-acetylase OafA/YrhL
MRVPGVDGLRGIAALAVAVGHAWYLGGSGPVDDSWVRAVISETSLAVDVFFVISGVIMLSPLASGGPAVRARAFYQRRIARLMPLYLLVLCLAMIIEQWTGPVAPVPTSLEGLKLLVAHLFFLQNATFGGHEAYAGFGVASPVWTLSVEAGFYLVFPFLASWWIRHPWLGLLAGVSLAKGWHWVGLNAGSLLADVGAAPQAGELGGIQRRLLLETPTYAGHFAVGMTLAVLLYHHRYERLRAGLRERSRFCLFLGGTWILAFMAVRGDRSLHGHAGPFEHNVGTLPVLPAIALVVLGAALVPTRALDGRVARFLADGSYSMYLLHLPAIEIAVRLGVHSSGVNWPFAVLLLGPVAGAVAISPVIKRFVEDPARRWINARGAVAQQAV